MDGDPLGAYIFLKSTGPLLGVALVRVCVISTGTAIRFDDKEALVDYLLPSAPGAMDRIQQKLATLRAEADQAIGRAEKAERTVKEYEQGILERDQEITSLQHKSSSLEEECDRVTQRLREMQERVEADGLEIERMTRQMKYLEQKCDNLETKYEEAVAMYKASQAELDGLLSDMGNI